MNYTVAIPSPRKTTDCASMRQGTFLKAQTNQEEQRTSTQTLISTDQKNNVPFRCANKSFLGIMVDQMNEK